MWRRRWPWLGSVAVVCVLLIGSSLHYFVAHATPHSALVSQHEPFTGVIESVPFVGGRLIVSEILQGGYNGWYLTKTIWG